MSDAVPSGARSLIEAARRCADELTRIRRDIHAHAELGFEEHRTAKLVADQLGSLGLSPRTGVGGTGVLADLDGGGPGPTVLLRADMDALPIEERSDAAYASHTGAMHACGHDGHVAMLLATAGLLVERRDRFAGRIRFLFQPAEERPPGGALAVIADGALAGVDAALGLHLWNPLPVGTLGIAPGVVLAAHDRLRVRLAGRGGHGAIPESTHDPVVALCALVGALQTVVSRSVSPLDSAVVTVGSIDAGTAFNVIPDAAALEGSIRSLGSTVRDVVHERIRAIVAGVAAAYGGAAEGDIEPFVPALVNDAELTGIVAQAARDVVGPAAIREELRTMGGEDMAFIHQAVPGCFVFVGSGYTDGREVFPHHHPSFDIDERSLPIGTAVLASAALAVLAATASTTKSSRP